jgi:uncharacterized membrane protein YebE (DUF533 family)
MDVGKLLNSFIGQGGGKSFLTGAVTGALVGAMTGKGGKKIAKSAINVGGLALTGGLAYKAYQQYQQNKSTGGATGVAGMGQVATQMKSQVTDFLNNPQQALGKFLPPAQDHTAQNTLALTLMRAMIAAAKADGSIDAAENAKIFEQVNAAGFSAEEKGFLLEELSKPLDINAVVATATSPEIAAEIYAASVLVLGEINPAEKVYLETLASKLNLDPALAAHLQAGVEQVKEPASSAA